jgi:hypothetical protein
VCPRYHLYMADLRAYRATTTDFWVAPRCAVISDVRISGGWVAWIAGIPPAGGIWAMNRGTRRIREVADQVYRVVKHPCPTTGCVPPVAISLSGGTLVWSHFIFSPRGDLISSAIQARSLPKGPPQTLYRTVGICKMQIDPQLSGGRLVWIRARWPSDVSVLTVPPNQCEGALQTDVMTKLIGRAPHLVSIDGTAANPQTNGRFISWLDPQQSLPACVCTGLTLLDTHTGRRLVMSRSAVGATMTSDLTADMLAWITESGGMTAVDAYNLIRPLPATPSAVPALVQTIASAGGPTTSSFIRTLGWGWERRLVWEQDYVYGALSARDHVGIRDVP